MAQVNVFQKKVCMLGGLGVGKTSLVRRFVESIFSERYHATVGVKIDRKAMTHAGRLLNLMLWDLQGEVDPRNLREEYLRGAAGFLIVADASRPETLDIALALERRAAEVIPASARLLVMNKQDLIGAGGSDPAARAEPGLRGLAVHRTSALTGEGVDDAFHALADRLLAEAGVPMEEA